MRRRTATALVLALVLVVPSVLAAQAATLRLRDGIAAYNDVDFVSAAALLRRALDPQTDPPLTPSERARALAYLGAAEFFRRAHAASDEAFRELVLLDPRYQLDPGVFPPRVRGAFASVRQTTKAADVVFPHSATIVAGKEQLRGLAVVSSPHLVSVRLGGAHDRLVRTLFDGLIDDSAAFTWNGLDDRGAPVEDGMYHLDVVSLAAPHVRLRTVRIPLRITVSRPDTLALPPSSPPQALLRPERTGSGPALAFLVPGIAVGAALIAPAAAGAGGATGLRIAAGGVALTAGVVGYLLHQPGRSIPANVAVNDSLRAIWAVKLARARAANAARRAIVHVTIRAGDPERSEAH